MKRSVFEKMIAAGITVSISLTAWASGLSSMDMGDLSLPEMPAMELPDLSSAMGDLSLGGTADIDTSLPDVSSMMDSMGIKDLDIGSMSDIEMGDLSSSFETMMENMETNADSTLAGLMGSGYTGLESNLFESPELPAVDMKSLNVKFAELKSEFDADGFGKEFEMTKIETKGYSNSSIDQFNEAFGDLDIGSKYKQYKIPSSFDADSMLDQMSEKRNSTFSDVKESDMYSYVNGNVSISSVFNKASKGVTQYDLSDYSSLKGQTDAFDLNSQFSLQDSEDISGSLPDMSSKFKTYSAEKPDGWFGSADEAKTSGSSKGTGSASKESVLSARQPGLGTNLAGTK